MPTAEGAIQLAMEELPITLHGARVLVIGYGRLGRVLADRLAGLKARVSGPPVCRPGLGRELRLRRGAHRAVGGLAVRL